MTRPPLTSRIHINDDVLFQSLNGEGVLLNLKTGVYLGLDPVGTRVWQLFEGHSVLQDVVRAITTEYNVSEDQCSRDLLALVAEMQAHGLITLSESQDRR